MTVTPTRLPASRWLASNETSTSLGTEDTPAPDGSPFDQALALIAAAGRSATGPATPAAGHLWTTPPAVITSIVPEGTERAADRPTAVDRSGRDDRISDRDRADRDRADRVQASRDRGADRAQADRDQVADRAQADRDDRADQADRADQNRRARRARIRRRQSARADLRADDDRTDRQHPCASGALPRTDLTAAQAAPAAGTAGPAHATSQDRGDDPTGGPGVTGRHHRGSWTGRGGAAAGDASTVGATGVRPDAPGTAGITGTATGTGTGAGMVNVDGSGPAGGGAGSATATGTADAAAGPQAGQEAGGQSGPARPGAAGPGSGGVDARSATGPAAGGADGAVRTTSDPGHGSSPADGARSGTASVSGLATGGPGPAAPDLTTDQVRSLAAGAGTGADGTTSPVAGQAVTGQPLPAGSLATGAAGAAAEVASGGGPSGAGETPGAGSAGRGWDRDGVGATGATGNVSGAGSTGPVTAGGRPGQAGPAGHAGPADAATTGALNGAGSAASGTGSTAPTTATSAAHSPAPAPGASTPDPVIDQVAKHLLASRLLHDGTQRAVLHLTPDHLGSVRVTVDVRAGQVRVDLAAGDGALTSLRRDLGDLKSQLASSGLQLTDVTLRHSGQDAASGGDTGRNAQPWLPDPGTGGDQAGSDTPERSAGDGGRGSTPSDPDPSTGATGAAGTNAMAGPSATTGTIGTGHGGPARTGPTTPRLDVLV